MVRVAKIAVWDVDGVLHRDAKSATKATRKSIIREMMIESNPDGEPWGGDEDIAEWIGENWDKIEARTEKAMAGT